MPSFSLRKLLSAGSFRGAMSFLRSGIGEKNYILMLAIASGLISGLAAVLLKAFAGSLHTLCSDFEELGPWTVWCMPLLPVLGIFLCIAFARFWVRGPYEKGLSGVIRSTTNGTSDVPKQKIYSHILTSGTAVGLGVSAGLEAPIALTGSAIGSNLAKLFHLGRESRTLLLACGGAAGVSAVFNSPVAGALFACEILLPEFSIPALIPLLIASAAAAVVSEVLYPNHTFMIEVSDWAIQNIPYYILLGLAAGVVSAGIIRVSLLVSKKFRALENPWVRGLAGACIVYCFFLMFPVLRGEGYNFVNMLVHGEGMDIMEGSPFDFLFRNPWSFLLLTGVLVLMKGALSSTCIESGGDGGIFAPSMFTGAFLGFFLARFIRMCGFFGWSEINETNFIAIGMGGVLAGVMHAPMTGIFLIAEITGGYKLFIPLMIVASLSCFICRKISRYNVYKAALAFRGETPELNKDAETLAAASVGDLAEQDFVPVKQDDTLRALLSAVMHSRRNIFPVLSDDRKLVGIVTLDNIRPFLLDEQLYDVALVFDVMADTGPVLEAGDSLGDATKLFENCRVWNLPVVRDGVYLGFVSKSGVFDRYRSALKNKPELF